MGRLRLKDLGRDFGKSIQRVAAAAGKMSDGFEKVFGEDMVQLGEGFSKERTRMRAEGFVRDSDRRQRELLDIGLDNDTEFFGISEDANSFDQKEEGDGLGWDGDYY